MSGYGKTGIGCDGLEATEAGLRHTTDEDWGLLRFSKEELSPYALEAESRWDGDEAACAEDPNASRSYRLRLELASYYEPDAGLAELLGGEEEKRDFLRLAKAERGISRDVVVQGDMNLHALHYLVQQAFGWANGHLHCFALPEDCFDRLTAGRMGGYMDLRGIVFRCGGDDGGEDLSWDDDYAPGQSVRTWLKRKYGRPFRDRALCDTRYLGLSRNVWFRSRFPELTDEMRLKELNKKYFEEFCPELTERLSVGEVFSCGGCRVWDGKRLREWKGYALAEAARMDDLYSGAEAWAPSEYESELLRDLGVTGKGKGAEATADDLVGELASCRVQRRLAARTAWIYAQAGSGRAGKGAGKRSKANAERALAYWSRRTAIMEGLCSFLFYDYVVRPLPFTDELLYRYDFGDDWCVKITLLGIEEHAIERARCVAADGLNLIDNCGGVAGYYDFLKAAYGSDPEGKKEAKRWAGEMGWTGRKRKPENIL